MLFLPTVVSLLPLLLLDLDDEFSGLLGEYPLLSSLVRSISIAPPLPSL